MLYSSPGVGVFCVCFPWVVGAGGELPVCIVFCGVVMFFVSVVCSLFSLFPRGALFSWCVVGALFSFGGGGVGCSLVVLCCGGGVAERGGSAPCTPPVHHWCPCLRFGFCR